MLQQFPFTNYRFAVFFLLPEVNINAGFESVSGLGFSAEVTSKVSGGEVGSKYHLTGQGAFSSLTLKRGFTQDRGLYEWCRSTHDTMQAKPCNILISLLDKGQLPLKNWLLFHAIPKAWNTGGLTATANGYVTETIEISYQNFILL